MRFETKIAIAVRDNLAVWQKLNVTAFLASGIASGVGDVIGDPYQDGSANQYAAMFRQPVTILTGGPDDLAQAFEQAAKAGLFCAIYTEDLFGTGNDVDNRAVVQCVAFEELHLAGFAVHGARNRVDRALKCLRLHA
jgi:hypothetical protein